jgi:tetratricopeptide (TPR) repeat protein
MTEDLVTRLAKLSGLLVIASSSTRDYRDPSPDIRAVARALGVRYVLTGGVRRARDRLRIKVQLVDSQSGAHLWADSYDRRADEVFGVEDEVVAAVVGALRVAVTPAEQGRLARLPTSNLEAYDLYLRAEHAARSGDLARLAEALPLYERAARLDPRFAAAHAGAGQLAAAIWREDMGFVLPPPLARALAYEHAGRALELDPSDPSPYSILALLRVQDRQYEDALDAARRAVALGPGDAAAQAALVEVLSFTGRHREAAEAAGRTLRLNPKLTVRERTQVGLAFLLNGDLPEAVAALRQASDEAPALDLPHRLLAAALERSGRRAEARAEADAARRALPHASLEAIRAAYGSFQRPEDLDAILASLHRAGVTLWPFGFEPDPEAALDGAAINALALGHTGRGTLGTGAPALMQIRQDGTMAWRTPDTILTGTVRIEHDQLCEISGSSLAGRPLCGPVQTTTPSSAAPSTHIYVNPVKLFRFSVD